MVRATCSALHCPSSSRTHKDLKFHQFPHDASRRKMWLLACKRSDVIDNDFIFFKNKYLCSKHFEKCMYSKKDHLKKSAVPSLHLSEKPLQHDSSTQTTESIEYVRPYFEKNEYVKEQLQNVSSVLYVTLTMPNVEKCSTSTYTQTEDVPYDIHHVNIQEETITDTKLEESETVKQDVEMKMEKDDYDEKSDSKAFEEYVEMNTENGDDDETSDSEIFEEDVKIEIVENSILPLAQPTQCRDPEIMKDSEPFCTQAEKPAIDKGKTATIVKAAKRFESTNTNNLLYTNMISIMPRQDKFIQTDRVIVLSQNPDGSEQSINPTECKCRKYNYDEMTRAQFFRCCSKFLSPSFSNLVRTQMYLDGVSKQVASKLDEGGSGSVEAGMSNCVEEEVIEHRGVVAPEVIVAGAQLYEDGVTKAENDEATGSSGTAGEEVDKGVQERATKRRKVVMPELVISDIKTADIDEDDL